jgi:outer membrane protein TolC
MSRHIPRVAFAIALVWSRSAAGQELLTVDAAVQAALAHNASLRAARAGVEEAAALADAARGRLFPRVTVSESWQRGNQPVFVFSSLLSARQFGAGNFAVDALNHPDALGFFRTSIGLEQVLFDGGRTRAAAAAASHRRDAAAAGADEAAGATAVTATEAFGRIVMAQAAGRAATAAAEAAREDMRRAGQRRDAGMATDADVLALAVHTADLERRRIQAQGDAATARAELNRLMGDAIEREYLAAEPAPAPLDAAADQRDLPALFAEADAARPEVKRTAAAAASAAAARRAARAALIPQVAAQGVVEVAGTHFSDRASSWIVGGQVQWTFGGGAETAAARAAAAALARADAEGDEARAAVHVEVVTAVRQLEAARASERTGRAAVEQAAESQRIVSDRFEAGMATVNDVLRASSARLEAESNRIAAVVQTMVAAAALRRALGRAP